MKVLVAADYCPQGRMSELFEQEEYAMVFSGIRDVVLSAHYSIINLECPVVSESNATPIEKCGPNLRCEQKGIKAIRWAGFDCVTLANNHFLDYGDNGVSRTLEVCENNGIETVGGGMDLMEASKNLFKQIEGKTLAVINCCEHEFSIATETNAGSNPLNPIKQYYAIKEAKEKADYVLVIVHGGHEHYNLPSTRMQEIYRFFIDAGADAVVNHHQHCYSGYEVYRGKPIFYGLGNFCFDKVSDRMPAGWYEGYMVELKFGEGEGIGYELIPYTQCKDKLSVELMTGEEFKRFFEKIGQLNAIIANPVQLKQRHEEWMEKNGSSFEHQFLPYSNHWLVSAYRRHLFPSLLSKERLLVLQNHFECESHRERSLFALNRLLKKG